MNAQNPVDNAKMLVAGEKGLLAMDESTSTCNKRLAKLGILLMAETRPAYRELIVAAPGPGHAISGAILLSRFGHQRIK